MSNFSVAAKPGRNKKRNGSSNNGRGRFSNNSRRRNSNKKKTAELPEHLFERPAISVEERKYVPSKDFKAFNLHPALQGNLDRVGYELPTEIQEKTYDHILNGEDVLGIAKTGTGKTAAFLIPLIQRLLTEEKEFQTLIVVPTRELAIQVKDEFWKLTRRMQFYSASFIGGTNVRTDIDILKRFQHVVVGTPGRLLDLSRKEAIMFEDYQVLVLDEYDRMLDMGFVDDVQAISDAMYGKEQTLLFSATTNEHLPRLVKNPYEVKINSVETINHIEQNVVRVPSGQNKIDVLVDLVRDKRMQKVILFAETKRTVDKLRTQLYRKGIKSDCIHGDKSQVSRQKALDRLKRGNIQVLVATDVAARGIDISDVTHVINFQKPTNYDSYVHRIGRTGRAGKVGFAYTFVN
ncbi:MAG: DEAD/DEAH box helicase [Saprospiraceae bacterium]